MKYTKAFEYYEDDQFVKSGTLLQYLTPIYKATDKAAKVEFFYAKSLYGQRDYLIAGYHFGEFAKNYGNSEYAEEATFMHAYCYFLNSPRSNLDQDYTLKAIDAFNLFLLRFLLFVFSLATNPLRLTTSEIVCSLAQQLFRCAALVCVVSSSFVVMRASFV